MRLARLYIIATLGATSAFLSGQDNPPDFFISKGACPFECCVYREWTALGYVALFDHPNGHLIGHIRKAAHVTAITGEVIAPHPLRFQVHDPRDRLDRSGVPTGAVVYLLHLVGEGFWLVWYHRKTVAINPNYANENFTGPLPKYHWWAKVKMHSGRMGWVLMNANHLKFENVDACA